MAADIDLVTWRRGRALLYIFFCVTSGQKREDALLFVLMKEDEADKHYLNWAISRDDYVCGFANCTAVALP